MSSHMKHVRQVLMWSLVLMLASCIVAVGIRDAAVRRAGTLLAAAVFVGFARSSRRPRPSTATARHGGQR